MRLAFKRLGFGFKEKEVDIILNLGTLEAVCKALGIEFWQITDELKKNTFDFTVELLYQGYVTACKERFRKPKYDRVKAVIWHEYMSQSTQKEFSEMITVLFGEISKTAVKKKVAAKTQN
jgi:hypothetical protein